MNIDIVLNSKKNICVKDIPLLFIASYHATYVKTDPRYTQSLDYHNFLKQFETLVKNSIISGDLIQRSPITLEPILKPIGNQTIGNYVVTVKDLTEFAKARGFNIVIQTKTPKVSKASEPDSPTGGNSSSTKKTEADLAEIALEVKQNNYAKDKISLQELANKLNPWELEIPIDPAPAQPWYTPARYFARELVKKDTTLLTKRNLLAQKISISLFNAGIYGRMKNKKIDASTILKALVNVNYG